MQKVAVAYRPKNHALIVGIPIAKLTLDTPSIKRLKNRGDFLRVAKLGRKWVTQSMVVQARRRGEDTLLKAGSNISVGFTVTKTVGNAVVRNRIKRRLKAVVSQLLPEIAQNRQEIVIIGRKGSLTAPFLSILEDLRYAMENLVPKSKHPEQNHENI